MTSRAPISVRALARQVHLWLGLSLGVLFAVVGLTGSILVVYTALDDALHPEISLSGAAAPPCWEHVLQTARATYPDKKGPWRFEVTGRGGDIPARYYAPPERAGRAFAPMMVWFSADGARVLRKDYWGEYAVTWIYDLHHRLLVGEVGARILGWSGIAMLVLLLSGLVAWWPRPGTLGKALRIKRNASPIRRLYDAHKLVGLASMGLLVLLTATGVLLAMPKDCLMMLRPVLGSASPSPKIAQSVAFRPEARISVDRAVAIAHGALPCADLVWIETPAVDHGTYRLRMRQNGDPSPRFPHSFVWVSPDSGRVLAITDARQANPHDRVLNWIHPLHDGSAGGLPGRVLALIVGLAPGQLLLVGVVRWRRRQQR
ncbi:PepSY domain-containing protein [Caulobacter sp. 602-1]|uniref:PepSY-associated TM helix domain-containing protein n=1 Tax=Caulobacter sp. 602-1 TaxID=2492472 RepID=UPI000F644E3B|nr:PepSY domain-containing protein [Caulobacter sp. 602-1]RRN63829.1 PepSY domain-containing protein [Caulobacter sp. 602-1]